MANDLRNILARSPMTLMYDAAGIAAIGVIMGFALYLPNFF
jgi:hypothetical protein